MEKCKNCKHWNNKQAELEYNTFFGICTCFKWNNGSASYGDVKVLDRNNRTEKHMGTNNFESKSGVVPIGKVAKSRYCFVTEETFGCVHFKNKKRSD